MGKMFSDRPFELQYTEDEAVVKCPWHGWEFDIATGQSVFNPHRVRVRAYEVTVELLEGVLGDEDPTVDTYTVTVEDEMVILHV